MRNVHSETNRSFYDRISHCYDAIADPAEHRAREMGELALDLRPGESVLEIGFGTGSSLLDFADRVGPTGSVAGIDISPRMLEVARQKLEERGLSDRVALRVSDARQLPFEEEVFDAVFMSFTLELFPPEDIPIILDEITRVLKIDGRVAVVSMATPRKGERANTPETNYPWFHRHFPHIVDCRPIDLRHVLESAHFTVGTEDETAVWGMPVRIAVASPVAAAAPY